MHHTEVGCEEGTEEVDVGLVDEEQTLTRGGQAIHGEAIEELALCGLPVELGRPADAGDRVVLAVLGGTGARSRLIGHAEPLGLTGHELHIDLGNCLLDVQVGTVAAVHPLGLIVVDGVEVPVGFQRHPLVVAVLVLTHVLVEAEVEGIALVGAGVPVRVAIVRGAHAERHLGEVGIHVGSEAELDDRDPVAQCEVLALDLDVVELDARRDLLFFDTLCLLALLFTAADVVDVLVVLVDVGIVVLDLFFLALDFRALAGSAAGDGEEQGGEDGGGGKTHYALLLAWEMRMSRLGKVVSIVSDRRVQVYLNALVGRHIRDVPRRRRGLKVHCTLSNRVVEWVMSFTTASIAALALLTPLRAQIRSTAMNARRKNGTSTIFSNMGLSGWWVVLFPDLYKVLELMFQVFAKVRRVDQINAPQRG